MLGNFLEDSVETVAAENNPPFVADETYEKALTTRQHLTEEWRALTPAEKETYNGKIERYYKAKELPDLTCPSMAASRSYYLLRKETNARLEALNTFHLLPINDLHFEQSLLELLENIENAEHVRELYKLRKRTVGESKNAGIKAAEASRLKNCMKQGRELYLAGKNGSLMVKPLNFFYSMTAYAYAVVILNNPIRYSLENLPGSHGINYIQDGLITQFGGDMPQGTFSDLFCAHPTLHVKSKDFELIQNNNDSIMSFFLTRHSVSVGTFLSMVPEIREYYRLVTGKNGRTHPLTISLGKDPRNIIWEFQIGDGDLRPNRTDVENAFPGIEVTERYGKFLVSVPASSSSSIRACIFCDARGELWYVENPFFPVVLPELCLHFVLTNTFSNLMRYSPDRWGSILLNEVNSDWSLLTRKYLSAFENKFPLLALRAMSKYYPYIVES